MDPCVPGPPVNTRTLMPLPTWSPLRQFLTCERGANNHIFMQDLEALVLEEQEVDWQASKAWEVLLLHVKHICICSAI